MTANFLNSTILRKLRDRIISALRVNDVDYQKHYSLSSVNQVAANFLLTLVLKSGTTPAINSRMSRLKTILSQEFPGVVFLSTGEKTIRIDLQKEYDTLSGTKKPEADVSDKQRKAKSQAKMTFLQWIQYLISEKFFDGNDFDGKFTKYQGNKEVALVAIPIEFFYKVLDYFIQQEMKVFPTLEKQIIVYKNNIPSSKERDHHVRFMTSYQLAEKALAGLKDLVTKVVIHFRNSQGSDPDIKCNTSISEIAINELNFRVSFTVSDPDLANGIASALTEMSIQAEKVGNIVYVELTKKLTPEIMTQKMEAFFKRLKTHKKGFVVTMKTGENAPSHMVIHISHDHTQFRKLPFNRPTNPGHVADLRKSIVEFGFLDFLIVARTDVVDGVMTDWIVDRQHRYEALVLEKMPIPYAFVHVHSKYELIRLIAALNSKSRKWTTNDYLRAWSWLKMEEYNIISEWKDRVPITIITQAMTGLDRTTLREKFQQGQIKFSNPEKGKKIITDLLSLKPHLPKGVRYMSAATKFLFKMNGAGDFTTKKLLNNISKSGLNFHPNDRDQDIIKKLEEKYAA